ncbi:MAG: Competence CoiA family protein [Neobacillus sp.]|nr:Competence CoiA family protein [Neobacillus sp.]
MLTAKTKTGKTICLGYDYKRETLLYFRNREEFICPVCGEDLSLKLGNQRIYHFAHKKGSVCREIYENESVYHMEGKRQLYQWLIRQRIPSVLEYYDPEIKQRPDIMFKHNGMKYALEYQCSTLSEDVFLKRTQSYIQHGYIPLWIIGSKNIKSKRNSILSLSGFDYMFLRESNQHQFTIPSYCPEKRHFVILGSIQPYSTKNALAQVDTYPINSASLDGVLHPKITNKIDIFQWNQIVERYNINWSFHPSPEKKRFLYEIYNHGLNLYLLPPEIGLPVPQSLHLLTPPTIWQTYIYIDNFINLNSGDYIHLKDVERNFNKRIKRKEINSRNILQITEQNPFMAVVEYLFLLEKVGYLKQDGKTIFRMVNKIKIPKSNRERDELKQVFFQINKKLLAKI